MKKYRKAVNAIIVDDQDRFFLVQKKGFDNHQWAYVGGGVEEGETYEEALYREIEEEIGLKQDRYEVVGRSKILQKYDFPKGFESLGGYDGQEKVQFVIRLNSKQVEMKIDGNEIKDIEWVPFEELNNMLVFDNQYDNLLKVIDEFSLK